MGTAMIDEVPADGDGWDAVLFDLLRHGRAAERLDLDERHDLERPRDYPLSVSNWQTSEDDVQRTIAAFAAACATDA